jgi:hypothetical protein
VKTETLDMIDVAGELLEEFDTYGEVLQTDERGRYGPTCTIERLRRARQKLARARRALANGRPHACRHAARETGQWLGTLRPAMQAGFIEILLQFCEQETRDRIGESYFNVGAEGVGAE